MNDPNYFRKGETLRAADLNDIVSAVRSRPRVSPIDPGMMGRVFRPFDVIDVNKEAGIWLLRLQPGYLIDGTSATAVKAEDATLAEMIPLTDHPDIQVESTPVTPKNLYFSYTEKALVWKIAEDVADSKDLILILTVTINDDESGVEYENHHPAPIYARPVVPFTVNVSKLDEGFIATVTPGYFRVKNPSTGDAPENPIKDWMPELNGTPLDEKVGDPALPPSAGVEDGDFVYLYFQTDRHGILEDPPEIRISTGEQSTHYQPDEDNGVDGEYWLRIASVSITDGSASVKQYQQGGPIEFVPNLWNYKQVGGGKKIIRHRDNENDEWVFRTIKEKSDPQIRVTQEDEYIEIKGNSYANSVTDARKVSISVADGLVTALSYTEVEDITGGNLNLEIRFFEYSTGGASFTDGGIYEIHYWRNGIYKGNTWTDPEGPPADLITSEVSRLTLVA